MTKNQSTDIGSPIKTFVNQTLKEINDGLPKGYDLTSSVDFELSVVNNTSKKGKIDVRVLSLGGDINAQNTQKVRFSIGDPNKAEQQARNVFKILKEELSEEKKRKKKK